MTVERRLRAWLALIAVACLLLALHSALRAVAAHRNDTAAAAQSVAGYETDDHFPGAALLYAAAPAPEPTPNGPLEQAAPAPGSTGTVAPPPEPPSAPTLADAPMAAVVAARPFALGHAAALDRGRALECLAAAIYYEAGNQGDDGERAVAQVVLNRVRHPAFPDTVCGVVYQGSEHAGCQFSFACDGAMARLPSHAGQARAMRVAAEALAGQVFAPVGLATHYHSYAVTPAWNRALVMTGAVGAHLFHRWKGYWGTAVAFHQPWSGHEPTPGPHPRTDAPAPTALPSLAPPVIAAATPLAPVATIQPSHAEAGAALAGSLPDSQILPRWEDSGRPLR